MIAVAFNFDKHADWMHERARCNFTPDTMGVVIEDHGYPVACAIADSWCPNSAMVHVAVDDPRALRRLAREFFTYVFITSGRGILIGTTPTSNIATVRFCEGMGFKRVGLIKDGYSAGVDFVIFQLNKEDCKFLPKAVRLQEVA